jgi:hypothetical protein
MELEILYIVGLLLISFITITLFSYWLFIPVRNRKVKPLQVNRLAFLITVQRNNQRFYQFK